MCGRYVIFTAEEAGELRLIVEEAQRCADAAQSGVTVKTGEVFPTDVAPVLVARGEGTGAALPATATAPGAFSAPDTAGNHAAKSGFNSLEARPMVWGYPGFDSRGSVIFNTRIEQAAQRPLWRESFAQRRCVVPTSGFFEWQHKGGTGASRKQKLLFTWPDEPVLYLAGIYRSFGAPADTDTPAVIQAVSALHDRFSIMTTAANASISDVHDRMPVVLRPAEVKEWLFKEPRAFTSRAGIELYRRGSA
jgi:putative SOS response-associated peptidase YedK